MTSQIINKKNKNIIPDIEINTQIFNESLNTIIMTNNQSKENKNKMNVSKKKKDKKNKILNLNNRTEVLKNNNIKKKKKGKILSIQNLDSKNNSDLNNEISNMINSNETDKGEIKSIISGNNDNLDTSEDIFCRICYENDSKEKLYNPCKCDGSIKWIHKSCLDKWRDISGKDKCTQCNYQYIYNKKYKYSFYKYLDNKLFSKILTFLFLIVSIIFTGLISKFLLKRLNPNRFGYKLKFNLSFLFFSTRYFSILFFITLPILSYFKLIDLNRVYNEYIYINNGNPINTSNTNELAIFVYYFFYGKIKKWVDNLIKSEYTLQNYEKDI